MRDNKPFISVITPTYNRKELLEKAILSVINQKKDIPFEWELITVDDGSKDGTREYIEKYVTQYPDNIRYIYQENGWVGKARNAAIDILNRESDYVIFLDSDDEFKSDLFVECLKKWEDLRKRGMHDATIWLYFLCEDEQGSIIGNRNALEWRNEKLFDYMSFLRGDINFAMMQMLKSSLFFEEPKLRFPEDVINETVMFVRMWQFMDKRGLKMLLWDYIGYVYNLNHEGATKITKTVSVERFRKNAIWNEQVFEMIQTDLLKFWFIGNYGEFLFRTWINWILAGEKKRGLSYLWRALKYNRSPRNIWIFILSILSRKIVLFIYKLYI